MLNGSLKDEGYIFAEVMLAVVLVAVMSMTLFPVYTHVQAERLYVSEQREAIHLLYSYTAAAADSSKKVHAIDGEFNEYTVTVEPKYVCIKWEGATEREAQHCFPK
ncbi:hypothetical protein [Salisediminibacterium halotolerans]|uniref:hypothetical protein n=1 Tax=Salisediminibacterium halotolerans TaxID=517425 RepID=UPI000EB013E8|nr:hypothetical protein [Salisediminibacterium halotolerans]RLJ78094.1 hypothetical protein BCL39_0560 [Actinophytocola xinjiangensis]RPE88568.1 hypothetical protein EDD67_0899 [Salisediminibacterium halotolerans]TWG37071.1 hypothetical protein BCL52_0559 [Salisediminibacterium halotolerans]GEL06926.1 hypothetical protein SHA02_03420 [Salisediminibacterium halotolerans]